VSFRWSPSVVQVAQDDSRCRLRGLGLGSQGFERLVLLFLASLFEAQTVKNTPFLTLKMCRSSRLFSFRIAFVEWELLLSLRLLCLFVRMSLSSNPRPPIASPPQVYRRVPEVSRQSESRPGNRDQLLLASAGTPSRSHQGGGLCVGRVLGLLRLSSFLSMHVTFHFKQPGVGSSGPICTRNKSISTAWHTLLPQDRFSFLSPWFGKTQGDGSRDLSYGKGSASGWSSFNSLSSGWEIAKAYMAPSGAQLLVQVG
jgi:hypothetical protein